MTRHYSEQPVGRDGFAQLLRAEFAKFLAVRGWMIALCTSAVVFVLLSFLTAFPDHSRHPPAPTGPGGEAVTDAYTFAHQSLTGDGTLTARVTSLSGAYTSLSNTSANAVGTSGAGQGGSQLHPGLAPWAKGGLIVEPDLRQGTDYAAVMVTGSHGVRMQYDYTHDIPGPVGSLGLSSPRWLRLTRVGDVITSYASTDDLHWTEIGLARLPDLPRTVQTRAVRHLPSLLHRRG